MESTHCQLCSGFTDGLCRDNADRFTDSYIPPACHVRAVAFRTDTHIGAAGQYRPDQHLLDACLFHAFCLVNRNHRVSGYNDFSRIGVDDIQYGPSPADTVLQAFNDLVPVHKCGHPKAGSLFFVAFAAVPFADDDILRNVYQTACQIAGVGCPERGIRQTFSCAVCRNKVLQNGKPFTEV